VQPYCAVGLVEYPAAFVPSLVVGHPTSTLRVCPGPHLVGTRFRDIFAGAGSAMGVTASEQTAIAVENGSYMYGIS
jgi:hypothetical protein